MIYSYNVNTQEMFDVTCDEHDPKHDTFCFFDCFPYIIDYQETPLLKLMYMENNEKRHCFNCYLE